MKVFMQTFVERHKQPGYELCSLMRETVGCTTVGTYRSINEALCTAIWVWQERHPDEQLKYEVLCTQRDALLNRIFGMRAVANPGIERFKIEW